ncbi:MAG: hypothetical protein ACI85L_001643 [Pseudomonadota bacterium]|jgi:hypothetical protein
MRQIWSHMSSSRIKDLSEVLNDKSVGRKEIKSGVNLHHMGAFNVNEHQLIKPFWAYECLRKTEDKYGNFEVKSRFYTKAETIKNLTVLDLKGTSLMMLCEEFKVYDHTIWNDLLAKALDYLKCDALTYSDDEIFIACPDKSVRVLFSNENS